jgi:hypothetical protein
MSINFRKTALAAGMFTALGGYTMSAHALIEGDAGEANLVPFVLWDDALLNGVVGDSDFSINTVIKITVPNTVGSKTIPNSYTACHTTPANTPGAPSCDPLLVAPIGPDFPAFAGLNPAGGTNRIHWYFMNQNSVHLANGTFPVSADDVAVIDWGQTARKSGFDFNGTVGYMILVTDVTTKSPFPAANFAFFAEAWMITGLDGDLFPNTNGAGTIGLVDAKIPVLPMQDGADPAPVGGVSANPTFDNNVVVRGTNLNVKASPLHSGMDTIYPDGNLGDIHEFDLTLGNRSVQIGPIANPFQIPTLMVIWNDRNAGAAWFNQGVEVYNDNEEPCSDSISAPWQLNVYWVQSAVTAGSNPNAIIPPYPVPAFINQPVNAQMIPDQLTWGPVSALDPNIGQVVQGWNRQWCVPPAADIGLTELLKLLQGGFMKVTLPELADAGTFKAEGAMVAFSVPLQYNVNFDATIPVGASLIPFETALGHDRGMFSQ